MYKWKSQGFMYKWKIQGSFYSYALQDPLVIHMQIKIAEALD